MRTRYASASGVAGGAPNEPDGGYRAGVFDSPVYEVGRVGGLVELECVKWGDQVNNPEGLPDHEAGGRTRPFPAKSTTTQLHGTGGLRTVRRNTTWSRRWEHGGGEESDQTQAQGEGAGTTAQLANGPAARRTKPDGRTAGVGRWGG